MQAAIDHLQNQLAILETNAPINEREGHLERAALERDHAEQIRYGLNILLIVQGMASLSKPTQEAEKQLNELGIYLSNINQIQPDETARMLTTMQADKTRT